jgi:hypothetical protein
MSVGGDRVRACERSSEREGSGRCLTWLDQVESVWTRPGLGQTSWASPFNHLTIINLTYLFIF